jgi:hypothetical protein
MPGRITERDHLVGQWLSVLIAVSGKSRVRLERDSGVSEGSIKLIERAGAQLLINTPRQRERAKRLATALGVNVMELLLWP